MRNREYIFSFSRVSADRITLSRSVFSPLFFFFLHLFYFNFLFCNLLVVVVRPYKQLDFCSITKKKDKVFFLKITFSCVLQYDMYVKKKDIKRDKMQQALCFVGQLAAKGH